jgi:hypothetical protein
LIEVYWLNTNKETHRKSQDGLFTAISAGFFLLLVGVIFVITPNLFESIIDFLTDFKLVDVPNTNIIFPGPEFPGSHLAVYKAAGQVSIALCLFQIVMLALRFIIPSSWGKRAETVGNFVYWAGAAFLIQSFLVESTQWFVFWSTIIIIAGISLIARAVVMAISRI